MSETSVKPINALLIKMIREGFKKMNPVGRALYDVLRVARRGKNELRDVQEHKDGTVTYSILVPDMKCYVNIMRSSTPDEWFALSEAIDVPEYVYTISINGKPIVVNRIDNLLLDKQLNLFIAPFQEEINRELDKIHAVAAARDAVDQARYIDGLNKLVQTARKSRMCR